MVNNGSDRHPVLFSTSSALGLVVLIGVGVAFGVLLTLVAGRWAPLHAADEAVVEAFTGAVRGQSWSLRLVRAVTGLGGSLAVWTVFTGTVLWLLIRHLPRLALYVTVTGLGLATLNTGTKALVARARPMIDDPIATASGLSFPSGHTLSATVTYGMVLLVFLPAVSPRHRRRVVIGLAAVIGAVGLTRVALGVHYPSDVVGGWLLGVLWLGATAVAFRRWLRHGTDSGGLLHGGLAPAEARHLEPAPDGKALSHPAGRAATLLVGAVVLWGLLVGAGFLVTDVLEPVRQFDTMAVQWFVSIRTGALTTFALAIGRFGSTTGVVVLLVIAMAVASGTTRRWRPPLFLLVAVAGESLVFLATAGVVARMRPAVEHLSPMLPPTSSFPSGHVAGAAALHGGIGILVLAWSNRRWLAGLAMAWAVLIPFFVALSRLYRGVHHPSDVVASALFAVGWLAVCWRTLEPGPRSGTALPPHPPPTASGVGDAAQGGPTSRDGDRTAGSTRVPR